MEAKQTLETLQYHASEILALVHEANTTPNEDFVAVLRAIIEDADAILTEARFAVDERL